MRNNKAINLVDLVNMKIYRLALTPNQRGSVPKMSLLLDKKDGLTYRLVHSCIGGVV